MNQFLPFLNWIENQADSQRLMIKAWAEINTFSTNVNGILQMTTRLLDDFKQLDGQQTLIDLPSWTTFERGQPLEKNLGPLLRIIKRPSAPIQVLLGGHMDTVFSPSSPFQSITERGKDSWVGPGLTDMKGGLGIMLIALAAFERAPISKNVGWEILINPDEEIGSPGSTPTSARTSMTVASPGGRSSWHAVVSSCTTRSTACATSRPACRSRTTRSGGSSA